MEKYVYPSPQPSPARGEGEQIGLNREPSHRRALEQSSSHRYYAPHIKSLAKNLRHKMTKQEKMLWNLIRSHKTGYKFRRQFAIDNQYIADFICLEKRLIIEIDGSQHLNSIDDNKRTLYLQNNNFRIIRFWNNEIENNVEGCYEFVLQELSK